jgi:hypothetical protein
MITQKHLLVQVPRDPSVSSFLQEFVEAKSKKGLRDAALHQMAHSLQTLFDLALPKILLYRFERLQVCSCFFLAAYIYFSIYLSIYQSIYLSIYLIYRYLYL